MTWDTYFIELCKVIASKSKDRSTKVGCVVIGNQQEIRSAGYNGFIRGANDEKEEWHERPKKYQVTIHAEANAIACAARNGVSLDGCIAYVTLQPCSNCTLLLVQAGIKEIRVLSQPENWDTKTKWEAEFEISKEILEEAHVPLVFIK